jgi:Carboxypeptidase regulatory-like domain
MEPQHVVDMRWRKVLCALVMLTCTAPLVACGASGQGTSPTLSQSTQGTAATTSKQGATGTQGTLDGDVVASPTCPVQPAEGNACLPKPVPSRTVTIVGANGQTVAKTITDSQGHFSLALAPGTYTIQVVIIPGSIGMRQVTPGHVTITSGQTSHVNIVLDTGIR